MPALSPTDLQSLLAPYLAGSPVAPPAPLFDQLSTYLDLLLRWNARTNLTAVRDPAAIVTRHFGESLFAARLLPPASRTLLDLGSGAGFPGLPLQLLYPSLAITLAESQGKKATFLREVVRTLGLPTTVHGGRAETLPPSSFDVVSLRAVDNMQAAFAAAARLSRGPVLSLLAATGVALAQETCTLVRTETLPNASGSAAALFHCR